MVITICSKTIEGSSDAAGAVNFHMNGLFTCTEPYFSWKVDVPGRKDTRIKKTIYSAFTDHDGILIGNTDMMRRLLSPNQRRDEIIEIPDFFF